MIIQIILVTATLLYKLLNYFPLLSSNLYIHRHFLLPIKKIHSRAALMGRHGLVAESAVARGVHAARHRAHSAWH